jgi:hypothetical protein
MMNFCCFKSARLWCFVIAILGNGYASYSQLHILLVKSSCTVQVHTLVNHHGTKPELGLRKQRVILAPEVPFKSAASQIPA